MHRETIISELGKLNVGANITLNDRVSANWLIDPASGVTTVGGGIKDAVGNSLDASKSSGGSFSSILTTKNGQNQYKLDILGMLMEIQV